MTHAGRPYPVLFRRDWNLGVDNNNTGWANRYVVELSWGFTTGFGTLSGQFTYDAGPATFVAPNEMQWKSPPLGGPRLFFYVLLHSAIQTGSFVKYSYEVWEPDFGVIYREATFQNVIQEPGFEPGLFRRVEFFAPTWFDTQPLPNVFFVRPKLWTDGPPH